MKNYKFYVRAIALCRFDTVLISRYILNYDNIKANLRDLIAATGLVILLKFPHSAFARGPRSPALEEGMRASMGATRECCAGPYA